MPFLDQSGVWAVRGPNGTVAPINNGQTIHKNDGRYIVLLDGEWVSLDTWAAKHGPQIRMVQMGSNAQDSENAHALWSPQTQQNRAVELTSAFLEARKDSQFGSPSREICGAKTRGGGVCRHPPLKGYARCLRHAGSIAARQYRERQWRAVQQGKMAWSDFARFEARRATNRLRTAWKKNPWAPGRTIDLGEHESRFQQEIGSPAAKGRPLPPAVVDWLRWRFRRTLIDRENLDGWRAALTELPTRVRDAGPQPAYVPPEGYAVAAPVVAGNSDGDSDGGLGRGPGATTQVQVWSVDRGPVSYKRAKLDRAKMTERNDVTIPGALFVAPQDETPEQEMEILGRLMAEGGYGPTVNRLFQQTDSFEQQMAILRALRGIVERPEDSAARERWLAVQRSLGVV